MASRKFVSTVLALGLSASILTLSCQAQSSPSSPPTQAASPAATTAPAPVAPTAAAAATAPAVQPTAAPETLKVGLSAPLSGPGVALGNSISEFVSMAVADLNAKGGAKVGNKTYRFELVSADDKLNAEGGRSAADRLVLAEKVRFILATISAPLAGGQAVTEPNKVIVLGTSAVKASLGPQFPYTLVSGSPVADMRTRVVLDWLVKEHPEVKRVAFVFSDDASGRYDASVAETLSKQRGITVVSQEFYPANLTDTSPLVVRVLRERPDAILTQGASFPAVFDDLLKTLSVQGFQGQIVVNAAQEASITKAAAFVKNVTVTSAIDWDAPAIGSVERELVKRARAKLGPATQGSMLVNYNSVGLLAQALEKAGTVDDPDKIVKTLRENAWDAIWSKELGKSKFVGAKAFGLNSQLEVPVWMSAIKDQKVVTFGESLATMD